jgi:hypothetical protein
MSIRKKKDISALILHCSIYLFIALLPFIRYDFDFYVLLVGVIIAGAHFVIDLIAYFIINSEKINVSEKWMFICDQIIHLAVIIAAAKIFEDKFAGITYQTFLGIDNNLLKWIAAVLFAGKPANIIFKKVFSKYRLLPENKENEDGASRQYAGGIIGTLERILTLVCIAINSYAGIGLILTAKSIARYDKISKNPQFAEYYLIGTLSSILFMVGAYAAIFLLL